MTTKRDDILAGLHAIGVSVGTIFAEVIPEAEHQDSAEMLLQLLNDIERDKPREEFKSVVIGVLASLGFEPTK